MNNKVDFNIEIIINEYSAYVFKIVNNIIGTSLSYQDKEEIVSDTFYLLWKNQSNINSNLKSYLGKIAKNSSYEKLRKNNIVIEYNDQILYQEDKTNDYEKLEIIKERINKLSNEEKELFTLFYVQGFKIKEIAKKSGKSIENIKIRLYRLRKKLKEELK